MAGSLNSIAPVINESPSATTATPSVQLGTRMTVAGIDYVYVYNADASSILQGQMGNLGAASMYSGYTVVVTNAASQVGAELVVGVAHNAAIPTATYGWLATRGIVYAVPDASSISANSGDFLTVGINGGFVATTTFATLGTSNRIAVCLNSFITTVGSSKVVFRSPLFG